MTKRHGAVVRGAADRVMMGVSTTGDDALVAAACRGDPDAFAGIYHRYKADVLRLAAFLLHDRDDAEDAAQDTFLKAYRGLRRVRSGQALRPWLLTTCRRTCLDRLRARPARPVLSLDDEDAGEPATAAVSTCASTCAGRSGAWAPRSTRRSSSSTCWAATPTRRL